MMLLCLTVAKTEAKVVTVTVNAPGTFAKELIGQIDSWSGVTELTVKGNINDTDMSCLSRLTSVVKIDLSQTKIKNVCGMNDLKKLTTVVLPTSVVKVNKGAFYKCSALKEISMPNVTEIDDEAFYYCQSLTIVNFPLATSIGYSAFSGCSSLTSVNFPLATSIGYSAFSGCSSLTSVNFPLATSIGHSAFSGCSSLRSVNLPTTLRMLDDVAGYTKTFYGCSKLKDIYCYVISPFSTKAFSDFVFTNVTLHVPAFCLNEYCAHESWYKFKKIVALEDGLDRIDVFVPLTITETKGIGEKADLNLIWDYDNRKSHLTVSTKTKWNIGKFVQKQGYYYSSTMIPYSEMTADNVSINYLLREENWNFISFPFDVNVSDIIAPKDVLWVIRKYSGEDRAKMTGKTWQNMTNGMTLKAGEGYILHYTKLNSEEYSSSGDDRFTFKAVNNSNKNNIFAYKDVTKPLATYASDLAHNRSWNLVGNPYPCYYDTRCIEHNGVITVWNGSGYTAYSLLDDKYVLQPNEAFFVQCPVGASSMKFKADGRQHEYEASSDASYSNAYRQNSANPRYVYNLSLAGTDYTDKARVVINETAKLDYEISCDASKFMSSNTTVPQLYVMENRQKLAIDERPLSNGTIALGTYFGKTGNYTIALMDNPDYTKNVMLTDLQTNTTVDLTKEAYQFSAVQGSDEERFMLNITDDPTGVGAIINNNSEKATNCYNLSGQQISAPQKGINIVNGKKTLVR